MPEIDTTTSPRVAEQVGWIDLDGEVVVFDPESGGIHLLEGTGAIIFPLLDGEATLGEVAAELAEAFGADPVVVEADVIAFAQAIAEAELLMAPGASEVTDG